MRQPSRFHRLFTNPIYQPGDTGPGGGDMFYDKGYYSNGWRYIFGQVTGPTYPWGNSGVYLGTRTPYSAGFYGTGFFDPPYPYAINDNYPTRDITLGEAATNTNLIIANAGSQSAAGVARYFGASGGNGTYSTHLATIAECYFYYRKHPGLYDMVSSNEGWNPNYNYAATPVYSGTYSQNIGTNGVVYLKLKANTSSSMLVVYYL